MKGRITSITETAMGRVLTVFVPKEVQPRGYENDDRSTPEEISRNSDIWRNHHFEEKCFNELCVGNITFQYEKGKF